MGRQERFRTLPRLLLSGALAAGLGLAAAPIQAETSQTDPQIALNVGADPPSASERPTVSPSREGQQPRLLTRAALRERLESIEPTAWLRRFGTVERRTLR